MAELPIRLTSDARNAVWMLVRFIRVTGDTLEALEGVKVEADGSILAEGAAASAVAGLYERALQVTHSHLTGSYDDWRARWNLLRAAEEAKPAPKAKRARKAARRG